MKQNRVHIVIELADYSELRYIKAFKNKKEAIKFMRNYDTQYDLFINSDFYIENYDIDKVYIIKTAEWDLQATNSVKISKNEANKLATKLSKSTIGKVRVYEIPLT